MQGRGWAIATVLVLGGCAGEPASPPRVTSGTPGTPAGAPNGPVDYSQFETFDALNACTGATTSYTVSGTITLQRFTDHYEIHAGGTIATADGYTGAFDADFSHLIIRGRTLEHLVFPDIPMRDDAGTRQDFGMGLYHLSRRDGGESVGFEKFGARRCVGGGGSAR